MLLYHFNLILFQQNQVFTKLMLLNHVKKHKLITMIIYYLVPFQVDTYIVHRMLYIIYFKIFYFHLDDRIQI